MPGSAALSNFLGYTSIACWLGAQFPQVLKNIQRQSCEGLSLPFLTNWLLGDFSNLIGCILTHQLPFQTRLAAYFVCVDLALVAQYFYYRSGPPRSQALAPSYSARAASAAPDTLRRHSFDRGAVRYRTLSAAASNVAAAAAAALAAQEDGEAARHSAHQVDPLSQSDQPGNLTSHIPLAHEDHTHPDPDEDGSAVLADSFHSEGGRGVSNNRLVWSVERHRPRAESAGRLSGIAPQSLISPTVTNGEGMWRGRRLQRQSDGLLEVDLEGTATAAALPPPSTIANRRDSRAGRKSATMVFLGAWALFSIGTFMGSKRGMPTRGSMSVGRVLSPLEEVRGALSLDEVIAVPTALPMLEPSPIVPEIFFTFGDQDPPPKLPVSQASSPSAERILGRIFAWLCTTLYLTSRLPQIWKNYVRQSVEGLSMYLFVFAFLGNTFYVASILSSPNCYLPPPASTEFLKESVPYLLGNGGTLVFDITIVSQSFLYRPAPKRRHTRSRSNTAAIDESAEEERVGLLSGDPLARHHSRHHPHSSDTEGGVIAGGDALSRGWTSQVARSLTE